MSLHVSTTETALAEHTLRDGVHGDELELAGEWLAHLVKDFPHGDELLALGVDVLLVHLVSQDHNIVTMANTNDVLQVLTAHHLPSWVAGVDNNDGTWCEAFRLARFDLLREGVGIESPAA